MIARSYILRLTQILAGSTTVYLLVMIATLVLQDQGSETVSLGLAGAGTSLWWLISSIIISKIDPELTIEVARLLYPTAGLVALVISVVLGFRLQDMVSYPVAQQWSVILAGILVLLVMVIKCFDIRWLRSMDEIQFRSRSSSDDSEY